MSCSPFRKPKILCPCCYEPGSVYELVKEPIPSNLIEIKPKSPEMKIYEPEIVDEEFFGYTNLGESLLGLLKRPKDVEIAKAMLENCKKLYSCNLLICAKVQLNTYLRYLIKVIYWSTQHYQCSPSKSEVKKQQDWTSLWLQPERVYIAIKQMPDNRSIIYMAFANDSQAGWEEEGFAHQLEKANRNSQVNCF